LASNNNHPARVMVTGGGGNLGKKLVAHLVGLPWVETIYALDIKPMTGAPFDSPKVETIVCDLGDANDTRWWAAATAADAIIHFAVRNPAPTGDWDDAVIAVDMTAGLIARSNPNGCRFLFASSNHAMGQYKDHDWHGLRLTSSTPPLPGTRLFSPGGYVQPNMYGATKLIGERLLRAAAIASGGRFTGIGVRIGWCLHAGMGPEKINGGGGGSPRPGTVAQTPEEAARDLIWFRNMWLSDRDLCAVFEAGLTADASGWPEPGIVVNGMSGNRTMLWDLDEAKAWIGYVPQDDVWTSIGIEPPQS
jgi:nucleoside-diphosphate-sugar epimerase